MRALVSGVATLFLRKGSSVRLSAAVLSTRKRLLVSYGSLAFAGINFRRPLLARKRALLVAGA